MEDRLLKLEDRLLKLLDTEQLSSSKFADVIGVQRSSVSHILTGRNKPSFDFMQKTLKAFPMLNADWLILGEGEMYEGEHGPGGGSLFDQPPVGRDAGASGQVVRSEDHPGYEASLTAPGDDIPEAVGGGERKLHSETVHQQAQQQFPNQGSQQVPHLAQYQVHHQSQHQVHHQPQQHAQHQAQQVAPQPHYQPQQQQPQQQQAQHQARHQAQQQTQQRVPEQVAEGPGAGTDMGAKGPGAATGITGTGHAVTSLPGGTGRERKVSRVILFYDDNSFDAFEPA